MADVDFGRLIPYLTGVLFGFAIAAAIVSLLGAIVLRLALKWVEKLDYAYGNAYVTVLISSLIQATLGVVVGVVVAIMTRGSRHAVDGASFCMLPVGLLIHSGVISVRVPLSFGRACLVVLATIGIALALIIAVALPVAGLMIYMAR